MSDDEREEGRGTHVEGDYVAGDKVGGDKVMGNKTVTDSSIHVGSVDAQVANIGGTQTVGDVAGESIYHGVGGEELAALFAEWNAHVAALPAEDQEVVAPVMRQVQTQAEKIAGGDESEETQNRLAQRLKNLAAMAPDIGDVVIASLVNPAAGIAMVIKKVAARVQKELDAGKA